MHGLRPNGEYEFRVLAKNADGLSEPSQSSGFVRIRPAAPSRSPNIRRTPDYDSGSEFHFGYGITYPELSLFV